MRSVSYGRNKTKGQFRTIRTLIILAVLVSCWLTHIASYHQFTQYPQMSLVLLPTINTRPSDAAGKQLHPSVDLLKSSGKNWKAWTIQDDILFQVRQFSACKWRNYSSQFGPSHSMPICLHPERNELMSSIIESYGYWDDCYAISSQWHSIISSSKLHIEVGANLGACVLELLLSSTEATIIAFEPHPINLFRLTSTLKMAPLEIGSRVTVFPVALSAEGHGSLSQ